jgi:hypothetical protein
MGTFGPFYTIIITFHPSRVFNDFLYINKTHWILMYSVSTLSPDTDKIKKIGVTISK